jgi:hypothetical protein
MKKAVFLILILFGLKSFGQTSEEIKTKIKQNKDQKKEIDSTLSKRNTDLAELNKLNKSDTIKTILYDFKTKKYLNSNIRPIVGEPLIFKIQNINRLAYNINIKSDDVAIADEYFNPVIQNAIKNEEQTQVSKEIQQVKIISKPNLQTNNLINPKIDIISFKDAKKNIQEYEQKIKIKEDSIYLIENSIKNSTIKISDLDQKKKISSLFEENQTIKDANIQEIELQKTNLNNQITTANTLKTKLFIDLDKLKKEYQTKLVENSELYNLSMTFKNLNDSYYHLSKLSQELATIEKKYLDFRRSALNPLLDKDLYEKDLNSFRFVNEIEIYEKQISDTELNYLKFYNDYNSAMSDWNLLDKLTPDTREIIRDRYQSIKFAVDELTQAINTKDLSSKLRRAKAINSVLKNNKAYEMSSSPIQPLEDYVTFEIEIKNRDDQSQYEYNDERKFTYMEYTQGGVRFDFSTGVVFDFGNQPTTYQLTDADVNNNKQIIGTSKNDFTPTLAGMFHTSFRRNGMWAFGLTLGASLNIETFQLNSLFPGISLLIGKKQKFVFTTGPAFKQVETLKSNYETDTPYNEANLPSSSDLTSKQFKIGYFVGITYNLTKEQKGTFKISDK